MLECCKRAKNLNILKYIKNIQMKTRNLILYDYPLYYLN